MVLKSREKRISNANVLVTKQKIHWRILKYKLYTLPNIYNALKLNISQRCVNPSTV